MFTLCSVLLVTASHKVIKAETKNKGPNKGDGPSDLHPTVEVVSSFRGRGAKWVLDGSEGGVLQFMGVGLVLVCHTVHASEAGGAWQR